jgi:hypothetical protein
MLLDRLITQSLASPLPGEFRRGRGQPGVTGLGAGVW